MGKFNRRFGLRWHHLLLFLFSLNSVVIRGAEGTVRDIILAPVIRPPLTRALAPIPTATDDFSKKVRALIEDATDDKTFSMLSQLLTEYLQLQTEIDLVKTDLYVSNPVFGKFADYPQQATAWLRQMHAESPGFPGSPPLTNKQVFQSFAILLTPIIVRELLQDPEWRPLLAEAIQSETRRGIPTSLSYVWAVDELLRIPPQETSRKTNATPSLDEIGRELDARVDPAVTTIVSMMNSNQVSASALQYVKVARQAAILADTATLYKETRVPGELLVKQQKAKALRTQLERRISRAATVQGR